MIPVLSCPLCGRPDEVANMTSVPILHAAKYWPSEVTLCQVCCLSVMDAVRSEIDAYNVGAKNDADDHFGLELSDGGGPGDADLPSSGGNLPLPHDEGGGVDSGEPSEDRTVREIPRRRKGA